MVFGWYDFEIDYDESSRGAPPPDPKRFRVDAIGFGGGPIPVGGTASSDPPWNQFSLPYSTAPSRFEGARLRMTSITVMGALGATAVRMRPGAAPRDVLIAPFDSGGITISLGGSIISGLLRSIPRPSAPRRRAR